MRITKVAQRARRAREQDEFAAKTLLVPASQHPLVDGRRPGSEFEHRLRAALIIGDILTDRGDEVEFLVSGSRHDGDQVTLSDAGAAWLLREGTAPHQLHGLDWLKPGETIYNGADELRVAARGLARDPSFQRGTYFCSPGQQARAERYAAKVGFMGDVEVPEALASDPEEQFHANTRQQARLLRLSYFDPGDRILRRLSQKRVPQDGRGPGTLPELIPEYAALGLPWYATQQAS